MRQKIGILFGLILLTASDVRATSLIHESFYLTGQQFTVHRPKLPPTNPKKLPLMVLLHGCKMQSSDILELTELSKYALEKQFLILTPDQIPGLNFYNCWNWFLPDNQQSANLSSELSRLNQAIKWTQGRYSVDKQKTFVIGFSSGAAMATNLFYSYPEIFAGVAAHSGAAFKSATDVFTAEKTLVNGSDKTDQELALAAFQSLSGKKLAFKKMLIFQGAQDQRVVAVNARQIARQFMGYWDYIDDGQWNQSQKISNRIMFAGDLAFPTVISRYEIGHRAILESVLIQNMEHQWSGGSGKSPYGEPQSPKATEYILNSFIP